jgi:hypothetical protein
VSSLSRVRVAHVVEGLYLHPLAVPVCVDFLYTPAARRGDAVPEPETTEVLGPVTPFFAGWSRDQNEPVVAVLGVGTEEDRALGAIEYLDPGELWAFLPEGEDEGYDEDLRDRNDWLFEELAPEWLISYRVDDPFGCFSQMEGLIADDIAHKRRPVIVPLGPKVFALCGLLAALRNHPWSAVWRISPGAYAPPVDRDSNGKLVGITATFSPRAPD